MKRTHDFQNILVCSASKQRPGARAMKTAPLIIVLAALLSISNVWAQQIDPPQAQPDAAQSDPTTTAQQPQTHPAAVTYSNGYEVRFKIHKYASFATLPLFATELALGQSLYNGNDGGGKRAAHGAIGTGIVGLFGVNTVTGVWNLWEARHDSEGKTRRTLHGILMMAADAGFVAASASAPSRGRRGILTFQNDRATHRDIAVASISVASVGYLMMLFHRH
jgi:hypothetical protein